MLTHKHSNDLATLHDINSDNLKITGVEINTEISFIKLIINLIFSKQAYIAEKAYNRKYERVSILGNPYIEDQWVQQRRVLSAIKDYIRILRSE